MILKNKPPLLLGEVSPEDATKKARLFATQRKTKFEINQKKTK